MTPGLHAGISHDGTNLKLLLSSTCDRELQDVQSQIYLQARVNGLGGGVDGGSMLDFFKATGS